MSSLQSRINFLEAHNRLLKIQRRDDQKLIDNLEEVLGAQDRLNTLNDSIIEDGQTALRLAQDLIKTMETQLKYAQAVSPFTTGQKVDVKS